MSLKNGIETPLSRGSKRPWSLAARLAGAFAVGAFLLMLAAIAFPYFGLALNLDREDNDSLTDKVSVIDALLHKPPGNQLTLRDELRQEAELQLSSPVLLRVTDQNGQVLAESRGMGDVLPDAVFPKATSGGPGHFADLTLLDGREFRVLSSLLGEGPNRIQTQVGLDRTAEARLLTEYRRGLLGELLLGLLACSLTGYFIARRGLRPITRMAETVQNIGSATLNARIDAVGTPPELSTLAVAFNAMLQRLEDAFDRLSRFSADIAHELRTPLNNVRGLVEVSLSKARSADERNQLLAASLEECERLSRLIDDLMFVARAENPQTQIRRQAVDLAQELCKMQEFYEVAGREAGITIQFIVPKEMATCIDRLLIQRALGNLIDNALAHTPTGGTVRVNAERRDHAVWLAVSDTGSGIPAEHLPRVFERFHRVDPSRSKNTGGLGLGLAIVKSIADLHGGTVEVKSEEGAGSCFTLILPDTPPN